MQLMPETARTYCAAPCSAAQNVEAGTAYLQALMQRYDGDIVKTLAAYDAGPRAVDRFGGLPPYRETQAYVDAILARMSATALADPN
jgi:soluble lytic murein transglycosylase-like protein